MNKEDLNKIISEDKRNLDIMVGGIIVDLCKQFDDKFSKKEFKIYDTTESTGWLWNKKIIKYKYASMTLDMPSNMIQLFGIHNRVYHHQLNFRVHITDFELACHKSGINALLANKIKSAFPDNSYQIVWNEYRELINVDIKVNE